MQTNFITPETGTSPSVLKRTAHVVLVVVRLLLTAILSMILTTVYIVPFITQIEAKNPDIAAGIGIAFKSNTIMIPEPFKYCLVFFFFNLAWIFFYLGKHRAPEQTEEAHEQAQPNQEQILRCQRIVIHADHIEVHEDRSST